MNKRNIQKVCIAGGTGFLGYYTALKFLDMGVKVDAIALPNELSSLDWMDKRIGLTLGNLFEQTEEEIVALLKNKGYDAFVYGLGPDDRVLPNAPAYNFFHEKLVLQCEKICRAAKKAGIKVCAVMGSYFAHFDKLQNGKLSAYHPYIRARREQEQAVFALADTTFACMVLELPYIFGTIEGRKPLWRESFLSHFNGMKAIYFPKGGGTAVIDVTGVAEAIVASVFYGESKQAYPVGQENMTFKELVTLMLSSIKDNRKYIELPAWLCALGAKKIMKNMQKQGKENGLNAAKLMTQIQNKKFYVNAQELQHQLHYADLGFTGGKNVRESIAHTMRACYPERFKQ